MKILSRKSVSLILSAVVIAVKEVEVVASLLEVVFTELFMYFMISLLLILSVSPDLHCGGVCGKRDR